MFKLLTILFILFYINQLIFQNREFKKELNQLAPFLEIEDEKEKESYMLENLGIILKVVAKGLLLVGISIVELLYIFFAFSYGSAYIVGGFLTFWTLMYIISSIKAKLNKDKPMKESYSIFSMFVNIIDLSFFIYIFIQLI